MRNTMLIYIDRFRHDRHSRRVLGSVLLILAIVVSLTVYWQLRLHGIAITNETYCGYEEHVHTDDCYEYTLICGLEETVGHAHTESCYDEEGNLTCGLEEKEAHTHTDECYEKTLICELEEHTHTADCLVDLEADVEDATVWEATLPELTDDLRTDIVNIAYSQLGYTESTANYTLADDGTIKMGYTRYGAWYGGLYYGSEYSDWDSLFVAFCLDYAGIAEDFTYNSGAYAWSVDLTTLGYYQTADAYAPEVGDVAFIDTDADGRANITAIVVSIDETAQTITVIQGNYTVTDSEGDSTDTVAFVTYSTATETVTQNEIIALSAGSEAEITPVILGYANVTYVTVTDVAEADEEVVTEETGSEEVIEEVAEEVTVDETEADETETEEAEEAEEETVLLTTASTVLTYDEWCSEAYSLYTYAMSVINSTEAASAWDSLMTFWDEIDAAYVDGTLTVEEYESLNDIMYAYYDEVYAYYTESIGYNPYGVMTVEETINSLVSAPTTTTNITDILQSSSISWSTANVEYADGEFTLQYIIDFSGLKYDDVTSNGEAVYIRIDLGDIVPTGIETDYMYTAYDGNTAAFNYWFYTYEEYDSNIGETVTKYYIVMKIIDTYLATLSGGNGSGEIVFYSHSVDIDNDGNLTYETNTGETITIDPSKVTHDENETWTSDITVTKSSTTYDLENNTITYTIYVSSTLGTNTITLTDLLSGYTDMNITGIEINSVQYQKDTDGYGNYGTLQKVESVVSISGVSETVGSTYYYTTDLTDGATSNLTITLSPLSGDTVNTTYSTGDRYVITYTVTFDPDSTEIDTKITNTATGTSYDESIDGYIIDTATSSRTVTRSVVDKSGSYESGEIIWTIDFNKYGADITGYTLTDSKFATAITDGSFTITYGDSNTEAVYDTDYEYVYDTDDTTIIGIKFKSVGTDGNTRHYTISYTESVTTTLGTALYKTDGNGKQDTSVTTTSDGTLTWKVYVYVEPGETGTFKITDTLQEKLSFVSAYVQISGHTGTIKAEDADDTTGAASVTLSNNGSTVDATFVEDSGGDKLTIVVDSTDYSDLSTDGGYIVITYTCSIDDFDATKFTNETQYTNSVDVDLNSADYGDDEQTQTVSYEEETPTVDYLSKSGSWNDNENILSYEVTFNLGAEDLDGDNDTLTLTDVLQANKQYQDLDEDGEYEYLVWGVVASLDINSVKFYKLYNLTYESEGKYSYTDSDGYSQTYETADITNDDNVYAITDGTDTVYYLKVELDVTWVYTEEIGSPSSWSTTTHTITATIPDSTAILFEYEYDVEYINNYKDSTDMSTTVSNSVSVSGGYSESENDGTKIDYNGQATSGSMSTDSLTIYKTDSASTGTLLSGAVFDLYIWNGSEWEKTDTQYTSDEDGVITVKKSDLTVNTAYYLVESKAPDGYILDSTTKYYFYASDSTVANIAYPDGWFSTAGVTDISTATRIFYASNTKNPSTILTISKTDSDSSEALSGAVFTLYYYNGSDWVETDTTYTSDVDGNITVTYGDDYDYTFATAYKLVETTSPEGYSIDSGSTIYFCWADDSGGYNTNGVFEYNYTQFYPAGWQSASGNDGKSESKAIDLATDDGTASVTNTLIPTTSVTVAKAWVDENGDPKDPDSSAYASFQLYYYLGDAMVIDSGGDDDDNATIYFGSSSGYINDTYTNINGIPFGASVEVKVTGSSSYNYYAIYAFNSNKSRNDSWDTSKQSWNNGWSSNSTISETFTTDETYPYYVVSYNVQSDETITVTYTDSSGNTYTNNYNIDVSGGWSVWTLTSGTGGGTSSGTTYTYNELTGVTSTDNPGVLYSDTVYTVGSGDWSYTIENLPKYVYKTNTDGTLYVDDNGNYVIYYYNYYFVETASTYGIDSAEYDTQGGVTGTTASTSDDPDENEDEGRVITVTNEVGEITQSTELPETGGAGTTTMYELGIMLILLAATAALAYRNISRIRKSLVEEPHREGVNPHGTPERLPDVRNRKFVIPRTARKGDTRAGPEVRLRRTSEE